MKWKIIFKGGSSRIAIGKDILVVINQLKEWQYDIEDIVSIALAA